MTIIVSRSKHVRHVAGCRSLVAVMKNVERMDAESSYIDPRLALTGFPLYFYTVPEPLTPDLEEFLETFTTPCVNCWPDAREAWKRLRPAGF